MFDGHVVMIFSGVAEPTNCLSRRKILQLSALEEHGMETAYIELELANQGRSDGNSTTGQQPEEGAETSITTEPEGAEVRKPASNDGLDVLV